MVLLKRVNSLEKKIRAEIIYEHLRKIGQNTCVCFTCGNAAEALREQELNVISVGEKEGLRPGRWFDYTDIQLSFNGLFDATSGHLPMPLMYKISKELERDVRLQFELEKDVDYEIPTGSGETIVCLKMAYPDKRLIPVRIKGARSMRPNKNFPLNSLIYSMFGTYGKEIEVDC